MDFSTACKENASKEVILWSAGTRELREICEQVFDRSSQWSAAILCVLQARLAKSWRKDAAEIAEIVRDCAPKQRSSEKERKGNALASGAEEGRDKLR